MLCFFFFSSRRRHTRFDCDWSSDVCTAGLSFRGCVLAERDAFFHESKSLCEDSLVSSDVLVGVFHQRERFGAQHSFFADRLFHFLQALLHFKSVILGLDIELRLVLDGGNDGFGYARSEEHTSELQSQSNLVCRLLL